MTRFESEALLHVSHEELYSVSVNWSLIVVDKLMKFSSFKINWGRSYGDFQRY